MTSAADMISANAIGASEIASVIGISPFCGRWKLWARRKGLIREPETPEMRWGKKVQRAIAEMFTEDTGLEHEWSDRSYCPPEYPFLRVTVDAFVSLIARPRAILEVKSVSLHNAGDWEKTYGKIGGADGCPDYVEAQVQLQLKAHGLKLAYVAAAIGNGDMRYYKIPADSEVQDFLLREAERFSLEHLMAGVEPPLEYSEAAEEYIRKRFPREREKIREAGEREILMLDEYASVRADLAPLAKRKKTLELELKKAVGDAAGLSWERGKFTWKKTKDGIETRWEDLARSRIEPLPEEERLALVAQYTGTKAGVRRIHFQDLRRGGESEGDEE